MDWRHQQRNMVLRMHAFRERFAHIDTELNTDINVWCSGKLLGNARPKRPGLRPHGSETEVHFRGAVARAAGSTSPHTHTGPFPTHICTCERPSKTTRPLHAGSPWPDRWLTEGARSSFKQTQRSGGICFSFQDWTYLL